MEDGRRVRHDLDLVVVAPRGAGTVAAAGRVVAWEDGRWLLGVAVGGRWVEVRGDRWAGSRPLALLLLRAAGETR